MHPQSSAPAETCQVPASPGKLLPFPSRARAPHPPPAGDDDDTLIQTGTRSSSSLRTNHITSSERRLGRWLRDFLGFHGASRFVHQVGAGVTLDVLHDSVLDWDGQHYVVPERLHNPAGLLRVQVSCRLRRKV